MTEDSDADARGCEGPNKCGQVSGKSEIAYAIHQVDKKQNGPIDHAQSTREIADHMLLGYIAADREADGILEAEVT